VLVHYIRHTSLRSCLPSPIDFIPTSPLHPQTHSHAVLQIHHSPRYGLCHICCCRSRRGWGRRWGWGWGRGRGMQASPPVLWCGFRVLRRSLRSRRKHSHLLRLVRYTDRFCDITVVHLRRIAAICLTNCFSGASVRLLQLRVT
jgi:hypothetical protein